MTDREYILKKCVYNAHGLQGPEVYFEYADGYSCRVCDCSGKTLRACKAAITEELIRCVAKYGAAHPIQPK